jgi:hypothetical protein
MVFGLPLFVQNSLSCLYKLFALSGERDVFIKRDHTSRICVLFCSSLALFFFVFELRNKLWIWINFKCFRSLKKRFDKKVELEKKNLNTYHN